MKPTIKATKFGDIAVASHHIDHDFFINAEGEIIMRDKSYLPKGSGFDMLSLQEADALYDPAINEMIIGSSRSGALRLSDEATDFFEEKKCKVKMLPLYEAISYWNRYEGHAIGLFHLEK
jgi:hypothetical protein